ncbi:MAG: RHS repeat-associated core domain-containing protein [Leptolyngbya sp. SIOISBB]|nr:RHS repeat-associated core domain-containing protein [Leptolyngbya sp. SIOISBB]
MIDEDAIDTEVQRVDYTYDVMNRRITKSVDSDGAGALEAETTHFVYDRDNVLLEFEGNIADPSIRYLHGPQVDQVLAQEDELGATQWLLGDHLGTIKDIVGEAGNLLNHRTFDSYGNLVSETNSNVETRYAFTGREFDEETDLHYYRARYYNSQLAQFISEDPISFESGTENLYEYIENRPVDTRDPLGLRGEIIPGSWNRHIFYEDNGRLFTDNIAVVRSAKLSNPNVSIISDITSALIRWAPGNPPPRRGRVRVQNLPDYIEGDHAGHIVARRLGGYIYDTDPNNYFAQDQVDNGFGGRWFNFETRVDNRLSRLHNNLKDCGGVSLRYAVSLDYSSLLETFRLSGSNTLRPDRVVGQAEFYGLTGLLEYHYENVPNPK